MLLKIVAYLIVGLYTLSLVFITLYCLIQFHLLLSYKKRQKKDTHTFPIYTSQTSSLPFITIQLPVFNELFVAERLIDNICTMDYPADKLEIQVLDDSTDDTQEICKRKVEEYKKKGVNITHIHRTHREGFKAGALKDGFTTANGEYIAIFDADFLPHNDFLLRTLPYFHDEKVGVVQTRWEHINHDYSLITKLQAFQLNVHFTIEQSGRQSGNYFLQFNGTGGIWRRRAIEDAGGWQADTLTEDLDLSYRAQLKGWNIIYCQDIVSPAELPADMNGLKSQQFRWMKGGAENARKHMPGVLRSQIKTSKKIHSIAHLLSSSIFLFVFIVAMLSVPILFIVSSVHMDMRFYWLFIINMLSIGSVYFVANSDSTWNNHTLPYRLTKFIFMFPVFLSLSMGLSLHNSIAVMQGYLNRKSAFIRTPKYNIQKRKDTFKKGFYGSGRISASTILEGLIAIYFLVAVIVGIACGQTSMLLYHIMLMLGFGSICIYSIKHLCNS